MRIDIYQEREATKRLRIGAIILVTAALWVLTACGGTAPGAQGLSPSEDRQAGQASEDAGTTEDTTQETAVPEGAPEEAAASPEEAPEQVASEEAPPAPEEGTPPTAVEAAATVIRALAAGNMETVAAWAHPDEGVRFSPYAYVDIANDVVIARDDLADLMGNPAVFLWGMADGSGDPIELTYADYHVKFVYDADFINDAQIAENQILGQGNSLNNLTEVYPPEDYAFVEYYIDGIDPQYEGMDWRSLRLVFKKIGADHALVAIIHDQWTI